MIYNLANQFDVDKCREYLRKAFSDKAVIELKKKSGRRSIPQNSYLHLLIGFFASQYGCSFDEAKVDFYKRECNREIYERTKVNRIGQSIFYLRSSADLDSHEMTVSIERFRNWSASVAGIYLPAPNENEMLVFAQQEIERNREFV